VLEAEYTTAIDVHCPLEPMNATAYEKDGVWHIHSGNQFFTRTTAIAAAIAGVDASKVVLHNYYIGGGFGRRLESDMVIPAIAASKAIGGKPVKMIYSREDDMQMDFTRPLTFQRVKVGLDANNKPIAMEHDVVGAWPTKKWGIPGFMTPAADKNGVHDGFTVHGADYWYSVPNHTVRNILNEVAQSATPSGHLRSVAPAWTFWAVESTIDEIAHAQGKDPVDMRLELLDGLGENAGDPKNPMQAGGAKRLANALRTAVGRSGYGAITLGPNEGMGVACVSSQDRAAPTWSACVAHVAVDPATGAIKVKKLTVAMDVGTAVNPDGIKAQIEGSALWGVSLALLEKSRLKDGALQATNFDKYKPLRMAQAPEVDLSIIANGEPAAGVGEPIVTVIAPALGNAIFRAVGARVRNLPITAEAVKAAMKA
jgi:isoquinoline 1-oxidoreductase